MEQELTAIESPSHRGEGVTILIVEDSPVQTELLRRALEGAGYKVIAARDGAEGLALAKANHPAVVVSDINMPIMDGYAMCHAIRGDAVAKHTPVILLTMLSDPQDVIRGLNAGADAYLTKPYNIPSLVSRIELLLAYPPLPPPATERRKVEVRLEGDTYLVDAHGPRMLNLLISTYENAVLQNRELAATQHALEDLNQNLEQKVLEKTAALRNSERRFRALIEHGSDLVIVIDASGRIVYVSPSIRRLGGYAAEEVLDRSIIELMHPDDMPAAKTALSAVIHNPREAHTAELRFRHKNGHFIVLDSVAKNLLDDPALNGIVINARDISERKLAQEALARKERYYRKLIEGGSEAFFVIDRTGKVLYRSESGTQLTGWDAADVLGKQVTDYVAAESLPLARDSIAQAIANPGQFTRIEVRMLRKDGTQIEVEVLGRNLLDDPDVGGIIVTARDISERKRAELLLQRERDSAQRYFSVAGVIMLVLDADGTVALINRKGLDILGYQESDVVGQPWIDRFVPKHSRASVRQVFDRLISGQVQGVDHSENAVLCEGGDERLITWNNVALTDEQGRTVGTLSSGEDITERKRAEQEIKFKNAVLSTQQETSLDAILLVDENAKIISYNQGFVDFWGMSEEMVKAGRDEPLLQSITGKIENPDAFLARVQYLYQHPEEKSREEISLKDGRVVDRYSAPVVGADGTYYGRVWYFRDISERKRAEAELRRLNWALRALGQSNSALVHAETEKELFQCTCDAIASAGGYPLAWIGLARDDAARSVELAAAAGPAIDFMNDFAATWADEPDGRGPTGTAIRAGTTQVNNDLAHSDAPQSWVKRAPAHGLAGWIALPIRANGSLIGALAVCSGEPDAFDLPEVNLFEELAADIGYGIAARRTRVAYEASLVERERATLNLRAAFESLITVLAATVERRDPYTAGHQRRVAELAEAIGDALGFDAARLEGLHFAATIHDIGKIYVPAEILARPGKLSATEFELVKSHAQVGYEIVKDVEFPWQVADMIRQHHERLDGSGYPQGLKADQILLESRILAVADVVEAMSSHRPYRPGLGLDAALAQIRREAGTKLDPQAVDACERVFREHGFSFSKA